jgi:hypothetical protein
MAKTLTGNFLNEFYKVCTRRIEVFLVAKEHIKYNYLPSEQYKEIWQSMCDHYDLTNRLLTIGLLTEEFVDDRKTLKVISAVKNADVLDEKDAITQLEVFIQNKIFIESYDSLGDMFNKNDKQGAFTLMLDIGEKLSAFTLKKDVYYTKIIKGLLERHDDRLIERENEQLAGGRKSVIPTGIKPLDQLLQGGIPRGNSLLILAQSGFGKSKFLKWMGISAARRGLRVLHVQGEGSKKEAVDAYDAGIRGLNTHKLKYDTLSDKERVAIEKATTQIRHFGGEIYVKAYEEFDSASFRDIRDHIQDITDKEGAIDLVLVDYLELFEPGNGKKYTTNGEGERMRRLACAESFKNICIEFDIAGATPTQSNDIHPKDAKDPEFISTRHNISESKKVVTPFPYFITINQTLEEKREKTMRLYVDKARFIDQSEKPIIDICTNFEVDRFYDHARSIQMFGYEQ